MKTPEELGEVLHEEACPKKLCSKKVLLKTMLPMLVIYVIIGAVLGYFVSKMMDPLVIGGILAIFLIAIIRSMYKTIKGMLDRLSKTCIFVCENGVRGVCPESGQKNRDFAVSYDEIDSVLFNEQRIQITAGSLQAVLAVEEPQTVAEMIKSRIPEKAEEDEAPEELPEEAEESSEE